MKILILVFFAVSSTSSWSGSLEKNCKTGFDDQAAASLKFWTSGYYGELGSPVWSVSIESNGPSKSKVLNRSGSAPYSWLVKKSPVYANGTVETQFQIASGKDDPEAGIVWRHQDGKTYMYVRANATKDNIVLYKMLNGKKEVIKEAETKIPYGTWHHLKAEFNGEHIAVSLDGKTLITVNDNSILKAGRMGFYSTADTVALFDNFSCAEFTASTSPTPH